MKLYSLHAHDSFLQIRNNGRLTGGAFFIASLILLHTSSLKAAIVEPTLPTDSQNLVNRLAEYEGREKKKLDQQLNVKRKEVLVILRKHLKFRTKNNQLQQALAIEQEIKRLESLLTRDLPKRIEPSERYYIENGTKKNPSDSAPQFYIDGDQAKGKIVVTFKHAKLEQLFNTFNQIQLEIQIANTVESGSKDALIVSYKKKPLGQKQGIKRGELVKINLETWKIARVGQELVLTLACSGKDGIVVNSQSKTETIALNFSSK